MGETRDTNHTLEEKLQALKTAKEVSEVLANKKPEELTAMEIHHIDLLHKALLKAEPDEAQELEEESHESEDKPRAKKSFLRKTKK